MENDAREDYLLILSHHSILYHRRRRRHRRRPPRTLCCQTVDLHCKLDYVQYLGLNALVKVLAVKPSCLADSNFLVRQLYKKQLLTCYHRRGVPRNLYWRGPEATRRRRRKGGEWGGSVPLPSRRELPQRGPGQSAGRKRFWCIFGLKNTSGGHKFGILYIFFL